MAKSRETSIGHELFDNRRKYPRLKMNLPVTVTARQHRKIKGLICNISPDGVQVGFSASDGADSLREKVTSAKGPAFRKCNLHFDLAHATSVLHVNINAQPVYLETINEMESACGMLFSEEDLVENKKISDFLFYQLQVSFSELESARLGNSVDTEGHMINARRTVVETVQKQVDADVIKGISEEVDELILQMDYSGTQLEPMRQLLFRVLNSLRVTQELTRHCNEAIRNLEQKISRKM